MSYDLLSYLYVFCLEKAMYGQRYTQRDKELAIERITALCAKLNKRWATSPENQMPLRQVQEIPVGSPFKRRLNITHIYQGQRISL